MSPSQRVFLFDKRGDFVPAEKSLKVSIPYLRALCHLAARADFNRTACSYLFDALHSLRHLRRRHNGISWGVHRFRAVDCLGAGTGRVLALHLGWRRCRCRTGGVHRHGHQAGLGVADWLCAIHVHVGAAGEHAAAHRLTARPPRAEQGRRSGARHRHHITHHTAVLATNRAGAITAEGGAHHTRLARPEPAVGVVGDLRHVVDSHRRQHEVGILLFEQSLVCLRKKQREVNFDQSLNKLIRDQRISSFMTQWGG